MSTKNINSIQYPSDLANIDKNVKDEYIYQSLANLGQRMGIQGDGVVTKHFTFGELIGGEEYTAANYIGHIQEIENEISFSIKDKDTLTDAINPVLISNIENYLISGTDITLGTKINGIDGYANNSIVVMDNNAFIIATKGYTDNKTKEFICEKFDKTSNNFISGIRLREVNGNIYAFYKNGENEHIYEAQNSSRTIDDYADLVISMKSSITPEKCIPVFKSAGFVWNNQAITDEYTRNKMFAMYEYDTTYLYRFFKEYYSEITYKNDNTQLRKQIVVSLFKIITSMSSLSTEVWVPLDYEFNYACNTNNEWQIYYNTTDVAVQYVDEDIDSHLIKTLGDDTGLICYTDLQERVVLFNYSVNYDNENSNTVYGINVYKHYTLPYINGEGYWNINDNDTDIYAKGKDAGNPNIIIIESHKEISDRVIVAGAHKEDLLENNLLTWTQKTAYTEPIEKINLEDLSVLTLFDYFKVNCTVPNMAAIPTYYEDEWFSILENSLIINIADLDCIDYTNNINYTEDDVKARYGEYGVITTIWTLDPETREFEYVRRQGDKYCAADFNYISNVSNLIRWHIENHIPKSPDRYQFSYVVFDAAYVALKNNTSDTRAYIYPNISNVSSILYNTPNYNNEFNFTLKYNDLVNDAQNNNIVNVSQSNDTRYFSFVENIVTNSLYGDNKEYIPNYNVPTFDLGEVFVRNENALNRIGIMSFNKTGATYYSYIGTSFENAKKNVLVIGSSNTNINIGASTLINEDDRDKFIQQDELQINFPNIFLSSYAYIGKDLVVNNNIVSYHNIWTKTEIKNGNHKFTEYSTQYSPSSRYIYEVNSNYDESGIVTLNSKASEGMSKTTTSSMYRFAVDNNKMFCICRIPDPIFDDYGNITGWHKIYIGDGIYIPALLNKLGLEAWVSEESSKIKMNNVIVNSNSNIYKYDGIPTVMQLTTTMLNDNGNKYYKYSGNSERIIDFTNKIFNGNTLNISYTVTNGKLYLTINEDETSNKISYILQINKEY